MAPGKRIEEESSDHPSPLLVSLDPEQLVGVSEGYTADRTQQWNREKVQDTLERAAGGYEASLSLACGESEAIGTKGGTLPYCVHSPRSFSPLMGYVENQAPSVCAEGERNKVHCVSELVDPIPYLDDVGKQSVCDETLA
eukprot:691456-Amphidinium_carterae.1